MVTFNAVWDACVMACCEGVNTLESLVSSVGLKVGALLIKARHFMLSAASLFDLICPCMEAAYPLPSACCRTTCLAFTALEDALATFSNCSSWLAVSGMTVAKFLAWCCA